MNRRDQLCDRALGYFLDHGLADLSLRPLAEQVGTSARLLIYHFESKENLIAAVMAQVRSRVQHSVMEMIRANRGKAGMAAVWGWVTDPDNIPYLRLLFEVQALALQNPAGYAQFLSDTSSSWLEVIEQGLPVSAERRAVATLCSAVIDGLMLEYLASGDLDRTTAALHVFAAMLNRHADTTGVHPKEG